TRRSSDLALSSSGCGSVSTCLVPLNFSLLFWLLVLRFKSPNGNMSHDLSPSCVLVCERVTAMLQLCSWSKSVASPGISFPKTTGYGSFSATATVTKYDTFSTSRYTSAVGYDTSSPRTHI